MKEKLSAMFDGDVDDATARALFDRLKHDQALRDEWDAYCLAGDFIRGDVPPELEGFTERVMARLEDEPVILAPSGGKMGNEAARRSWHHRLLPLAASVMGVLAVGGVVAVLSHETPAPVVASIPVIHSGDNGARHGTVVVHQGQWVPSEPLPGFELMSMMRHHDGEAMQMMFSDGAASLSILIEPANAGDKARGAYPGGGTVNVFERIADGRRITVMGEVPAPLVRRAAESIGESR